MSVPNLPAPLLLRRPFDQRLTACAAFISIPLIAWSRDIAVVTLLLAFVRLVPGRPPAWRPFVSAPTVLATVFLLWSAVSLAWAPHFPWETWIKTVFNVALGTGVVLLLARQSENASPRTSDAVAGAALALTAVLVIERLSGGFFIGLHREAETTFQRLTALSGGLVLLCTTCFACALVFARYLGAVMAIPLWIAIVLAITLAFPMNAAVVAVICGSVAFAATMVFGKRAAGVILALAIVTLVGWGFVAESAARAGLHHWLIANVDPNWGYRVEIWRYVNDLVWDRMIAGHGFDAARVLGGSATLLPSFEGKTSFLHPHNGMLQLWLELGVIGVALFVAIAALGIKSLLGHGFSRLSLAVITATVVTTATIWSLSFGLWQGWWLAVIGLTASGAVMSVNATTVPNVSRRRLLFLATEYYFFDALRKELTQGATALRYEVFVAARCRPEDLRNAPHGITVIPFDWKRSRSLLISLALFLPDLVRVGRLLGTVSPHVLYNIALKPSVIASLAAAGRDITVINAIHGFGFSFMRGTPLSRIVQAGCGLALRLSARANDGRTLVINRHDEARVRNRMGLPERSVKLLPGTGIDLERFMPQPDPPKPFRFLVIGRLLYMKGTDIVVEAHRLLRTRGCAAELVICGSPDPDNPSSIPEAILRSWAERPGLTLVGQVADVRPFLAACHVLVHPSLGGEGLPRALTEAAASSRALIATNIPGNTEIAVHNVTGLLVTPGDVAALADAMQWVMEHDAERLAFARAGRTMVEARFASAQVAEAHTALFREITEHAAGA